MELKDKIKKFVTDFRDGAYQHDTKRDSGLPHDIPEVERLDNLPYGPDEKWHTLDVYLPKKHEAPSLSSSIFTAVVGFMVLKKSTNIMEWV